MGNYRQLDLRKANNRPSFERMIADLQHAKQMWDTLPHRSFNQLEDLHNYSLVLLKLVGTAATEEAKALMDVACKKDPADAADDK